MESKHPNPSDAAELESKEEVEVEAPKAIKPNRHCAFCLKECDGSSIKLCGGCKKRAYCSKECQKKDWSTNEKGQRHVNWCRRYEHGEEDIDWEIAAIPNKGLGVRAKRLLPAGYKIIVEPVFTSPYAHPGVKDLEPKDGTLEQKFTLNSFSGDDSREYGKPYTCLRITRVNHSCHPNAEEIYDDVACVEILYAIRDIQPGEEISIEYYPFADFSPDRLMAEEKDEFRCYQVALMMKYGFACPADCFCNNLQMRKMILQGRKLYEDMLDFAGSNNLKESLEVGEKIIEIYKKFDMSWIYRSNLNEILFKIAIASKATMSRSKTYIQSCLDIYRMICPYSSVNQRLEKVMKNPEISSENYLRVDKEKAQEVELKNMLSKFRFSSR